jgi:hypothetical protein
MATQSSTPGVKILSLTFGWTCQHRRTCDGPFFKALSIVVRSHVIEFVVG